MSTVKAITILQPWAWAVVGGLKRFENREWRTDYVGPLVIHAGKSDAWMERGMKFLRERGVAPLRSELEFGAVLGVVDMVDCKRVAECGGDEYAWGPYCFELARPRRLVRPVPMRGQVSLWNCEAAIVAELLGVDAIEASPEGTKEERLQRAIAAAGPGRVHRIEQGNLW